MGIYIKGMEEMPLQCVSCKLWTMQIIGGKGYDICRAVDKVIKQPYGRQDFCPLVPVAAHGDLISRKWLIDIALHLLNTAKNDDIANGVKWLWQYIIEAPTIIPASDKEE